MEFCSKLYKKVRKGQKKTTRTYQILSAMSEVTELVPGQSVSSIRESFGIGQDKAKQYLEVKCGNIEKIVRKKRKLKITLEQKSQIIDFFERGDISRLSRTILRVVREVLTALLL